MPTNDKKRPEVEEIIDKVIDIVRDEFMDFSRYMITPQDKAMMGRKFNEYLGNASYRITEELKNGRADATGTN